MAKFWIKFPDTEYPYVEWNSITDTPSTRALTQKQFDEYVHFDIEGRLANCLSDLEVRRLTKALAEAEWRVIKDRLQSHGTSVYSTRTLKGLTPQEAVSFNRSGLNNTCLSYEQFVAWYCVEEPGTRPTGIVKDPS